MNEAYLQYIWRYKRIPFKGLHLIDSRPFELLDFGTYNTNSGADFFNAKIKIDDTIWAGNIEIHVKSSDWKKHKHQNDAAYDNVILHVVYEHDLNIFRTSGEVIPTFELKKLIDEKHFEKYESLLKSSTWIPCQKHIKDVSEFTKFSWLERLTIERYERKTQTISKELEQENFAWEEVFYRHFLSVFGGKVNKEQFYAFAKNLPLSVLQKNADNLHAIESLFFGISGLLENHFEDDYPNKLKAEFSFFKTKYGLTNFPSSFLKFSKLRPANFPTLRLVQFAQLMNKRTNWLAFVLEADAKTILQEFDVELNDYWLNHYVFDKLSISRKKSIGKQLQNSVIINVVVPFLFLYARFHNKLEYQDKAIDILQNLPSEKNSIIEKWLELGVKSESAFTSQALLELKNEYCSHKKCVNCAIGVNILNAKQNDK
jgi:hypothetical protein